MHWKNTTYKKVTTILKYNLKFPSWIGPLIIWGQLNTYWFTWPKVYINDGDQINWGQLNNWSTWPKVYIIDRDHINWGQLNTYWSTWPKVYIDDGDQIIWGQLNNWSTWPKVYINDRNQIIWGQLNKWCHKFTATETLSGTIPILAVKWVLKSVCYRYHTDSEKKNYKPKNISYQFWKF